MSLKLNFEHPLFVNDQKPFFFICNPSYVAEGDQNGPEQDWVKVSGEQRFPDPGEPVCVICGRYGEYICDEVRYMFRLL